MATTYAADTPANQAAVDTMVDQLRAFAVALRGLNQRYAALLEYWFNGNPGGATPAALVGSYTGSSTIPNSGKTNWAGATQVLAASTSTMVSYLQAALALNDAAHVDVMVPFAGPANI